MITNLITATLLVAGIGLLIGLLLGVAQKKLAVESNPTENAIRAALPGNNCGGCGYPGCDALAAAIACKKAPTAACPVGGSVSAKKIAEIMGEKVEDRRRMVAFVHCSGDCDKSNQQYEYYGTYNCAMLDTIPGKGSKICDSGCLGYGNCVRSCPFDAIHIINGIAVVDKEKCRACRKCMSACPKHLISLVPYDSNVAVACSSSQRGKTVMNACKAGCISCTKCEKVCPNKAITLFNNIPMIDYDLCDDCQTCKEACPRKVIH